LTLFGGSNAKGRAETEGKSSAYFNLACSIPIKIVRFLKYYCILNSVWYKYLRKDLKLTQKVVQVAAPLAALYEKLKKILIIK